MVDQTLIAAIQDIVNQYHRVKIDDIHHCIKKRGLPYSRDDISNAIDTGIEGVLLDDIHSFYPQPDFGHYYYVSDEKYRVFSTRNGD